MSTRRYGRVEKEEVLGHVRSQPEDPIFREERWCRYLLSLWLKHDPAAKPWLQDIFPFLGEYGSGLYDEISDFLEGILRPVGTRLNLTPHAIVLLALSGMDLIHNREESVDLGREWWLQLSQDQVHSLSEWCNDLSWIALFGQDLVEARYAHPLATIDLLDSRLLQLQRRLMQIQAEYSAIIRGAGAHHRLSPGKNSVGRPIRLLTDRQERDLRAFFECRILGYEPLECSVLDDFDEKLRSGRMDRKPYAAELASAKISAVSRKLDEYVRRQFTAEATFLLTRPRSGKKKRTHTNVCASGSPNSCKG